MSWLDLSLFSLLAWCTVLFLPWQPWRTRERLEASGEEDNLSDVTVLIPARNEEAVIGDTVSALLQQGRGLEILLIDDASEDGTAEVAMRAFEEAAGADTRAPTGDGLPTTMRVIQGEPLPSGWGGKLWALEQGRERVATPLVLLLDADIALKPGLIAALRAHKEARGAALVSLMALLRICLLYTSDAADE